MTTINQNLINQNFKLNDIKNSDKRTNFQNNFHDIKSFKEVLATKSKEGIQFSKHASMRLNSRNLKLSNNQIRRIEDGIKKAEQKGINDSLVLLDNIALLINIKSKTVVTAIINDIEKVYSNIDGAVIV